MADPIHLTSVARTEITAMQDPLTILRKKRDLTIAPNKDLK